MGPFRGSNSRRRERKPSDRKESRVRSRPFPNRNSARERFKGRQGHWCESLRILKAGDGWEGGFPPSRLLFLELLFFGPTCADDSAVQRLAL